MVSVLDRLPSGSRVAVIRLRSLGDCVLTTPALALLKAHRPDLKVQIVVEPKFAAIYQGNPDVDEILDAPHGAELVLNLHGGTRSQRMTAASRARFRVGFVHHRYSSFVYTHAIPRAQEILEVDRPVHTVEHLASAMFWLGVPEAEIPRAKLCGHAPERAPYVAIHPFASAPEKAWSVVGFLAFAEHQIKAGLEPVILAGPGDDVTPFSGFEILRAAPLSEVKNLISGATFFLGNDSGPAHIAAAFGVPVIALFGPSDPAAWGPWRTESQVLKADDLINIKLDQVLAAAEALKVKA